MVQRFSRDGVWQADIGYHADDRERGRIGVLGGLATDRDGHLLVLDSENDRVQVFDADSGRWLAAWGTRGTGPGQFRLGRNTGAGGIAVDQPQVGEPATVYIADQNNHRVQAFTLTERSSSGDRVGALRLLRRHGLRRSRRSGSARPPSPRVTVGVDRRRSVASLSLRRGTSRLWFTGRLRGRKLPRGAHRLTLRAVDAAGNRSEVTRLRFRVR